MPYRWKQFLKCLDIGDEKYHISFQQNTLLKKVMVLYKFINIWIKNYKMR